MAGVSEGSDLKHMYVKVRWKLAASGATRQSSFLSAQPAKCSDAACVTTRTSRRRSWSWNRGAGQPRRGPTPFFHSALQPNNVYDFLNFTYAGVTTLGKQLHVQQAVGACPDPAAYTLVCTPIGAGMPPLRIAITRSIKRVGQLLHALPAAASAAAACTAADASPLVSSSRPSRQMLDCMLTRLGWRLRGQPWTPSTFIVRAGTDSLTSPTALRQAQHAFSRFL